MELLKIESSKMTTDGSLVSITFETDEASLPVVVDAGALSSIIDGLSMILAEAKRLRAGNDLVSAGTPKSLSVRRTKDRSHVIVHFEMQNGHQMAFALPMEAADHLRSRIAAVSSQGG